ncbi:MAG: LysR family transcriptional regulator [Eggerthellaceae bacterium]|nr:LysR family transcriptional regulator [Eggerthellaceae bacterium]
METSRYRALLKAIELGSFSKAAKDLAYTPSGVSQLISALEKDVGFAVLERTRTGVELTNNGKRILPIARAIIQEEDRLFQMSSELKGLSIGSVTIGSYPSVASHWLPKVLKEFRELYPGIEIRVMEGIHQEISEWLDNKEVDFGFMSYDASTTYDWVPLAYDPMIAVLPANHPLAQNECYPLEQCSNEDFIMPGKGQDIDTLGVLSRHDLHPRIAYETIETAATLGMIEAGMGITITNSLSTEKYDFKVSKIPIEPSESILVGIAIPDKSTCAPAARHFIEFAAKRLQQREIKSAESHVK